MKTVQYLNCSHLLTSCSTSCVQLHPMYLAGECPPRWDFSVLLESTFLTTASFLPRYVCFWCCDCAGKEEGGGIPALPAAIV